MSVVSKTYLSDVVDGTHAENQSVTAMAYCYFVKVRTNIFAEDNFLVFGCSPSEFLFGAQFFQELNASGVRSMLMLGHFRALYCAWLCHTDEY